MERRTDWTTGGAGKRPGSASWPTSRSDAQREQTEVDRDAAKRRVLLARVRDERAYHERMVGELTEATRRLEAFIRDLQAKQRRLARVPPPKRGPSPTRGGLRQLRGRLPWPTEGRIIAAFGAQVHPRFGTRTFRNGVDIEANEGQRRGGRVSAVTSSTRDGSRGTAT